MRVPQVLAPGPPTMGLGRHRIGCGATPFSSGNRARPRPAGVGRAQADAFAAAIVCPRSRSYSGLGTGTAFALPRSFMWTR